MPLPKANTIEYANYFIACKQAVDFDETVDSREVESRYNELLRLNKKSKSPELYNALGMGACLLGKKEDAIRFHKAALIMGPNIAQLHHNFSVTLSCLGDYKEAAKQGLEAVRKAPDNLQFHLAYLDALELVGDFEEAKRYSKNLLDGLFKGNEDLINHHEDLLEHDQIELAHQDATNPGSKFIPLDEAIAHLEAKISNP